MAASPLSRADVAALRAEFPALALRVNGAPLAYLDNASTTQKPSSVIAAVVAAYEASANVHRGVHALSVAATRAYEAVRDKAAALVGARSPDEIVFVRGTTEALNLIAQTYGRAHVGEGDEVVVTALEHHANIVPWQLLCREKRAVLRVLPIDDRGDVVMDALDDLLGPRTRVVSIAHASSSLGTVLPVAEIARRARAAGAVTVVDGAQAIAHMPVDVGALGCDFYAFSGHKLYGPTGAGVLWGRRALLDAMPPWQGGGDMIASVSFAETTYADVPHRFEAGTPDIAAVIGLGAAIDWVRAIGLQRIAARDAELSARLAQVLEAVPDLRRVGAPRDQIAIASFNLGDVHTHDVGTALDLEGIAVRTGHHCTEPAMSHFGVDGAVRASLGVYTTEEELDRLGAALVRANALFAGRRA